MTTGAMMELTGFRDDVFAGMMPARADRTVDRAPPSRSAVRVADRPAGGSAVSVTGSHPIVERVARSRMSVLILGETGAGKEVMARRLHDLSPRAGSPFVAVNVAAICATLIESELFGFERGAFTGATVGKLGLVEAADGGTFFMDEVGELALGAQVKLLRVLENRTITRVGGISPRPLDVRFIAATNRDLHAAVAEGTFRGDLLYRLEGIGLQVAPLRWRREEILPAARQFLSELGERERSSLARLTPEAERALVEYDWPGNFRELRNAQRRCSWRQRVR